MLCPLRLDIDTLPGIPQPIDLALIKQHCEIDHDDRDDLLTWFALAAIEWAEGATHRTIFSRAHRWVLKEFPIGWDQSIWLPRGRTVSVEKIDYVNGGVTSTLTGPSSGSPAGTDYQEDLRGDSGATLLPPRGGSWPSTDRDVPAPVTIEFTAGWDSADVPPDLLHAILFSISDAFDLRGTSDFQPAMLAAGGPRFQTREMLVSGWRLSRWY